MVLQKRLLSMSGYTKEDLDAMSSIYNLIFANKVTWPEVLELIEESGCLKKT